MVISQVTDFISSENSMSKSVWLDGLGVSSETPNHLAIVEIVVPCNIKEISVQKNTMLKINLAFGTSWAKGKIANTIGTAPLNPTHDIKVLSLNGILRNGKRQK